jgi:hypothetical protein
MFILLDENKRVIQQSMEIKTIINSLGFLNATQYYNYKQGKLKEKFKHLDKYEIVKVNQYQFFQDENLLFPINLLDVLKLEKL